MVSSASIRPWCGRSAGVMVSCSSFWTLRRCWVRFCLRKERAVSHTVLVCDDAIFMRTMISDILGQAGFEVVGEAETGTQAVEKYRQLKPDLVTMAIVMPDMGGIDAVREIVKQDPAAKILMCSAMGQRALVVEAIQDRKSTRLNSSH